MRLIIHRAIDPCDPTAALGACIDQEHLLDRVAGQAIGSREHHACKSGHGGTVAEAIKARTRESGPALAVIAVDMLCGDMPSRMGRDGIMQAAELLVDRLLW